MVNKNKMSWLVLWAAQSTFARSNIVDAALMLAVSRSSKACKTSPPHEHCVGAPTTAYAPDEFLSVLFFCHLVLVFESVGAVSRVN